MKSVGEEQCKRDCRKAVEKEDVPFRLAFLRNLNYALKRTQNPCGVVRRVDEQKEWRDTDFYERCKSYDGCKKRLEDREGRGQFPNDSDLSPIVCSVKSLCVRTTQTARSSSEGLTQDASARHQEPSILVP